MTATWMARLRQSRRALGLWALVWLLASVCGDGLHTLSHASEGGAHPAACLACHVGHQAAPPVPASVAVFPPPQVWIAFVPAPVPSKRLLQTPPRAINPRGPPA